MEVAIRAEIGTDSSRPLTLVRKVGPSEGLYTAKRAHGWRKVAFEGSRPRMVDFRGGASPRLDLRPVAAPDVKINVGLRAGPPRRPANEAGARQTVASRRNVQAEGAAGR